MESSAHADLEPELPRRIGRYEAFLQIGAGGMARVYLAVQNGPFAAKRLVVLKQLREEIANDPQFLEMFIDEARIALRLNHPNVVHTYEVLDEAPDYYLVMEYLEGQSLLEILRRVGRQKLPLQEHIWILTQLLAGLHYAHELRDFNGNPLQIVHRDVTPSNVFVCKTGGVKLLDFGIAKLSGAVAATRNGILKGKLGYVAPEQCLGHAASVQSDIYAVGVMLWEAMARRRRSGGETEAAQIQARIQGSEPPIEKVWPQVPVALAAVARRALSTQPEHRYATARDFQRDLERYLVHKQSRAGAESLSRILRPYFEKERAALYHTIAAKLEESTALPEADTEAAVEPAAAPAPLASENDASSIRNAGHAGDAGNPSAAGNINSDANTSLVSIDLQLLRATKPHAAVAVASREFLVELRRAGSQLAAKISRGAMRGLMALHARRRSILTMAAAIVTAALVSTLAETHYGVSAPDVDTPHTPARDIAVLRSAAAQPPDLPPEPRPTSETRLGVDVARHALPPVLELPPPAPYEPPPVTFKADAARDRKPRVTVDPRRPERRRGRDDGDLDSILSTLGYETNDRPRTRATGSANRTPADARSGATHIEPGMDLRLNPTERAAGCIDEQDPY